MHFAYAHNREWDAGKPRAFDLQGDWTKLAGFGQAAWLFRSGAIQAGPDPLTVPLSWQTRLQAGRERVNGSLAPFLERQFALDRNVVHTRRVQIARNENAAEFGEVKVQEPYRTDTGELTFRKADRLFLIHAPKAAGVVGFLSSQEETGPLVVRNEGAHFVAVLLTSLDDQPLESAVRMLLTVPGYALRSRAGADPPVPQAMENYQGNASRWTIEREPGSPKPSGDMNTGGARPVWLSRVPVTLLLKTKAESIAVYPLDGAGRRMQPLPLEKLDQGFLIRIHQGEEGLAPWYEIMRE
jgi:hypothetical protein